MLFYVNLYQEYNNLTTNAAEQYESSSISLQESNDSIQSAFILVF